MAAPSDTHLFESAAASAAERMQKERTYRSKVRVAAQAGLDHMHTCTPRFMRWPAHTHTHTTPLDKRRRATSSWLAGP
jgi:hypothetical protein